ncbi:hypothetical protein BaRGS_00006692 [Batillaria attramentaria]|uniref:C-type lectin domain-containing protein n=1 Tax=Batillaria attramentaria TaxID=370345 RepID=A0ABD0LQZ9_9CAEN
MTHLLFVLVIIGIAPLSRSLSSKQREMNMDVSQENENRSVLGRNGQEYKTLQPQLLSPKVISPTDKPLYNVSFPTATTRQDENERESTPSLGPESTYKHLNLSSENITNCFLQNGHLHFAAREGQLTLRVSTLPPSVVARELTCDVTVTVPFVDHVFSMRTGLFERLPPLSQFQFTVFDHGTNPPSKLFDRSEVIPVAYDAESVTNKVTFQYKLTDKLRDPVHMQVTFVAVPSSEEPHLEVIQTTPTAGYIQTPGFDGTSRHPRRLDSWARVDVPEGHAVMLSFQHLDIKKYFVRMPYRCKTVQIYQISNMTKRQTWDYCFLNKFPPTVLTAQTVEVYAFFDSVYVAETGFRLTFSFHNYSEVPQKIPNGPWNCSVPYWADFRQHFPCNLIWDCEGGEDEVDCPYTTRTCGPGYVTAGGHCYVMAISSADAFISRPDASKECQLRGLKLVSLNTPAEWDDVMGLLETHHIVAPIGELIHVGLTTANPSVPIM